MAKRVNGEGSYYVRNDTVKFIITINGERKQFYGKTKQSAYNKYIEYVKNAEHKKPKSKQTFSEIMNKWWERNSITKSGGNKKTMN